MSHLRVIEWTKNVPVLILVNSDTRHIVERCNVGATSPVAYDDEYLPACGRCGEALRPSHDIGEVVTHDGDHIVAHAEPCCAEVIALGGHLA